MGKLVIEKNGDKYQVVEDLHNTGTMYIVKFEGTKQECQDYLSKYSNK